MLARRAPRSRRFPSRGAPLAIRLALAARFNLIRPRIRVGTARATHDFQLSKIGGRLHLAEAGLVDVGPLVTIWFGIVTIRVLRKLKWINEW